MTYKSHKNTGTKYMFDTNVLLKVPSVLRDFNHCAIVTKTIFDELDYRKGKLETQEYAQLALKHIKEKRIPVIKSEHLSNISNDEKIISEILNASSKHKIILVSEDNGMNIRAKSNGIRCIDYSTFQKEMLQASDVPSTNDNKLFKLVKSGNYSEAEKYIEKGMINPNFINKDNYTPLIYFIRRRKFKQMEFWLDIPRCDINKYDNGKYPMPPFMHAAQRGWLKGVKYLVEKGANTSLLSRGKNKGNSALLISVWDNRFDIVKYLLEKRDLNISVNQADGNGFTPIIKAAIKGHVDIIKYLLNFPNIDIYIRDREGKSALDHAKEKDNKEIIEMLRRVYQNEKK